MTSVGGYMTAAAHTINADQSLAVARRLMSERQLRYLPVLHDGKPVGVLSSRMIQCFEALPGSGRLTVEEAMLSDVYMTHDGAPLDVVAEAMALGHIGAAIVLASGEETRVLGVFTVVDALRALTDALRSRPAIAG